MSISPELEQEVRRLLTSGKKERPIAERLGVSRRQVANIKKKMMEDKDDNPLASDLRPTTTRPAATAELMSLSTRPDGVRFSEAWPILRSLFGMRPNEKTGVLELAMNDNQRRYLKEQTIAVATAQGKEALFLPEWLPRQAPVAANDMLVSMAGFLHERAQEYASDFMNLFPDASRKHVFNELLSLAFAQPNGEPVHTRCQRNSETAKLLQERLGNSTRLPRPLIPSPCDAELDTLCV